MTAYHPVALAPSPARRVLSPREYEIAVMVCRGMNAKEIARELGLSWRTVESHRLHIRDKLDVHSPTQLAALMYADKPTVVVEVRRAPPRPALRQASATRSEIVVPSRKKKTEHRHRGPARMCKTRRSVLVAIRDRVDVLGKRDGRTYYDVAAASGVNKTTIHHWLADRSDPQLFLLEAVINSLGGRLVVVWDDEEART